MRKVIKKFKKKKNLTESHEDIQNSYGFHRLHVLYEAIEFGGCVHHGGEGGSQGSKGRTASLGKGSEERNIEWSWADCLVHPLKEEMGII